ncbi:DNA topoisomerase IV subunit A [Phreatobacter sp. AB_2022a]|uniref:DNA topoisomerase IV subunit A n=1 Tax=Phreatobacter sp. AB_2022a TaxID=3003134 RepID=UPI0022872628|nr:DNA topoisomerase IV subunit A [Phreatobacter sp. AB_2022a]MCZ0736942.1 DNA topoisomerase IV subunit A [Phreatobacter sp. AB_2022a]
MGERVQPPGGGDDGVESINLRDALEERYLSYALSTIMGRALPDARDGLKPVHRRILHAMRLLKLDPGTAFKKCARIVGDVIGKFHPHGDQSVYDALVRLAQDFAQRYPLVDGQGNFGNIDGDGAAAYRYTEARMTEVAALLLEGINEDAVDFRKTYNEEDEEPVVLPGAFPNLLANGSQGIAVGMATSIPPHNAAEICDAALHLIANPKCTTHDLLAHVPGPDFPTGGIIIEGRASIAEAYETGRGGFRTRARWHQEDTGRGTYHIVVTEIPYGVTKGRLIEKIAELIVDKKLPLVADFRDESAEDIRLVFEPRSRNVDGTLMMESLFRLTELESRVPLNMNVLMDGKIPRVVGLKDVLRAWVDHRRDVLLRRSRHRLAEIERRLEVLAGLIIAYLNIDEVIRIIRTADEPKKALVARFDLTEVQVEAILNMRLRSLAKLEEIELRKEYDELTKEKDGIVKLLGSEALQWKTISWEIGRVKKQFSKDTPLGRRRTTFGEAVEHDEGAIAEALVEREPITVVVSEKGWIRALKGHVQDLSSLSFKTDDRLKISFPAETTSKLLVFATNGKVFTLEGSKLPGGRGAGEPIRLMIDLEQEHDIADVMPFKGGRKVLLASREGRGFVVAEDDLVANTRKGKGVMGIDQPDELVAVRVVEGEHVAVVGENRKLVVFPLSQVPEMARGKGVRLQKYKGGGLADVKTFALAEGLTWKDSSDRTWTVAEKDLADWLGNRADAGRLPPKGFPKNNKFG